MCQAHGLESGHLAALGIPPAEILGPARTCPSCGRQAPAANICHVCGGPGEPGSYWRSLIGRDLISEGPAVDALALAAHEAGHDEGRLDERGFADLMLAAGVSSRRERDAWRRLLALFVQSEQTGRRLAEHEQYEKLMKGAGGAK